MTIDATPSIERGEDLIEVQRIMRTDPRHARLRHDPAYASGSAYVIDRIVPLDEAAVPVTDLGFTRSDAVYDVVTVSRGLFFRLDEHRRRFADSCRRMRLTNPRADEEAAILDRLVALTGLRDAYVWWGVTRGRTPMASADRVDPTKFENRFFAYVVPYIFIADDALRARGLDAVISQDHQRIPPRAVDPRAKNMNGLDFSQSLFEAGARGADWSILTDGAGNLTEAPGANLLLVKDGALITPDAWCLEGVTRQTALELAEAIGLRVEARRVPVEALMDADEAFYTSSAGGIMPVNSVDGTVLGGVPGPGPVTRRLHDLYWEKRWAGWHGTPVGYANEARS